MLICDTNDISLSVCKTTIWQIESICVSILLPFFPPSQLFKMLLKCFYYYYKLFALATTENIQDNSSSWIRRKKRDVFFGWKSILKRSQGLTQLPPPNYHLLFCNDVINVFLLLWSEFGFTIVGNLVTFRLVSKDFF